MFISLALRSTFIQLSFCWVGIGLFVCLCVLIASCIFSVHVALPCHVYLCRGMRKCVIIPTCFQTLPWLCVDVYICIHVRDFLLLTPHVPYLSMFICLDMWKNVVIQSEWILLLNHFVQLLNIFLQIVSQCWVVCLTYGLFPESMHAVCWNVGFKGWCLQCPPNCRVWGLWRITYTWPSQFISVLTDLYTWLITCTGETYCKSVSSRWISSQTNCISTFNQPVTHYLLVKLIKFV